jgi:hypothetical protein
MELFKATLWIYKSAFLKTIQLLRKNWGLIFAPLAYSLILSVAALLLGPFWLIGGIVLWIVTAACASSGLYLIENVIRMGRATISDFKKGFTVYLGEILTIGFILWIPMMLLSRVAYATQEGALLVLAVKILVYVILNAVPELIYQSRLSGLALLSGSYQFIVENWVEWLLPNLLIAAVGYLLAALVSNLTFWMSYFVQFFISSAAFGLFLTFLMLFRGVLFAELNGTTRRSRLYRYRANASQ